MSHDYEIIIISDANTLFIEWILEKRGLKPLVNKVCVYSN